MELRLEIKNKISQEIYSDMEKQFPPEELKPFACLDSLLGGKDYKFAIFYDDTTPVGYVFFLKNDFIWIDYIAVFEKFHSKGYGSKILDTIFDEYSNLKGCFFEVEPEDNKNMQTVKRMKFYKKLGCENLEFNYFFPNDLKELKLELLYKSFNKKIPNKKEIFEQINYVFETLHSNVKSKNVILKRIKSENI